jgi:hypothetical protein
VILKKLILIVLLANFFNSYGGPWQKIGMGCAMTVPGAVVGGTLGGTIFKSLTPGVYTSVLALGLAGLGTNVAIAFTVVCIKGCYDGIWCGDDEED